ncbi:MAG: S1 family peptidase [Bacillota bacterium]
MRQHIEHVLAASGALVFALFVSYFNTGPVAHVPAARSTSSLRPVATETVSFGTTSLPGIDIASSTLETLFPVHPKATSTPAKQASTTPAPTVTQPKPTPKPAPTPTPTPAPAPKPTPAPTATSTPTEPSDNPALTALKKASVNILCLAHDGSLRSISGSGTIIDSRGIVLTVAHVAQASLLQEYLGDSKVSCTIRTGSPARDTYTARPIYVSDEWIKDNPTTLISSQPTGTGEHDYALLAITGRTGGGSLPSSFSAVPLSPTSPRTGDAVLIGSYGAQELSSSQIRSGIYPTFATSTIIDRFTFDTTTIDVIEVAGSAASQEGSSGGAIVNSKGQLIGLITTSQISGPVSQRKMHAITADYIRRDFGAHSNKGSFGEYFGSSLTTLLNTYAPTAQKLGQFIADAIGF